MEMIRNYLETMFANLPNTPEVVRAKNELWQMMEDKYNELKEDGKSENEAIGIVISEFGNLDELSEDLGIQSFVEPQSSIERRNVSLEESKKFVRDYSKYAFWIALGVLFCIISPCGAILSDIYMDNDILGVVTLFGCIALAIMMFIIPSILIQKWDFLKKENCFLDFATTQYLEDQKNRYRTTYALLLTIGIVLCILSVIPVSVFDELEIAFLADASSVLLFVMVGIGVFMIILANMVNSSYEKLLSLNDSKTVGGNFVPSQKKEPEYKNPTANAIMSVFWSTITCIYLCWSFLTFHWHITWIIWPIAAVIHALLSNIFEEK